MKKLRRMFSKQGDSSNRHSRPPAALSQSSVSQQSHQSQQPQEQQHQSPHSHYQHPSATPPANLPIHPSPPAQQAPAASPPPPNHAQLFREQGDLSATQGDYNKAVIMYETAATFAPDSTELLLCLAFARMMCTPPQLDKALDDVNKVIQKEPSNPQAYRSKGDICESLGRLDDAEGAFTIASQISSGIDRIKAQQALALVRAKRAQAGSSQLSIPSSPAQPQPSVSPISASSQTGGGAGQTTSASGAAPLATQQPVQSPPAPRPASTAPGTMSPPVELHSTPSPRPASTTTNLPTGHAAPPTNLNPTPEVPPVAAPIAASQPAAAPATTSTPQTTIRRRAAPTVAIPPHPPPTTSGRSSTTTTTTAQSTPAQNIQPFLSPPGQTQPRPRTPAVPVAGSPAAAAVPAQQPLQAQQAQSRAAPPPAIQRQHDATTVNQTPAQSIPFGSDLFADIPTDPPPGYSATSSSTTTMTAGELDRRLTVLETQLAIKNKGSLALRPFTLPGQIDAIQLLYVGLTSLQLTERESPKPVYLHAAHSQMSVSALDYPGSTFIDTDPETAPSFDGKISGTTSISAYSEEYREDQLRKKPILLNLHLEADVGLPRIPLSKIVDRINLLRSSQTLEDDEGLKEFLGLSQLSLLTYGFGIGGTRQKRIDSLCLLLSRAHYDEPARFPDFRKLPNFASLFLMGRDQETATRDFLYQIMLGAELLIRLRKQPLLTSYQGIMTDHISTLIVCSSLFMAHVTVTGPRLATTSNLLDQSSPKYSFSSLSHIRQTEALIRFGEAMSWPFMDEARAYIINAYGSLTRGEPLDLYMMDWLFGMVLPGKYYRRYIMCCLVHASPSTRTLGVSSYFESGLVISGKSYWPKRTVLGRVLGGLRNPRVSCGWIGPVPIVKNTSGNALEEFGFDGSTAAPGETPNDMLASLTDPVEWIAPTPPPPPPADQPACVFKSLQLEKLPPAALPPLSTPGLAPVDEYRTILDFDVRSKTVRYTLYSNPVFVTAPACVGEHVMHRRQAQMHMANTVTVDNLKDTFVEDRKLLIINAQGKGDEIVARAWCAERGKSAVVRRNLTGYECCFVCACTKATRRSGLGVGVLIWSC